MKKQATYNKLITVILLFCLAFITFSMISTVSAVPGDAVYVNGSSGNDSWDGQLAVWNGTSGPKLSIKNATGTVNTNGTIYIANGRYIGANNTNIVINKNMIITGQSSSSTIIDAQKSGGIFFINSGITVNISNLTLINGNATFYGGAIDNKGGNLTVNSITFTDNTAATGGAIDNIGVLNIINSTFRDNTALNSGGAISNFGNLTVTGSTFTDNTAAYYGGAIYNANSCNLTVNSSTFTGDTAQYSGSAIYNYFGNLTVNSSTFTGNTAPANGGAISNDYGTLTVTGGTFTGNIAGCGGALYNYYGTLIVHFNRFIGNIASQGSDIYNSGTSTVNANYNWWGSNNSPTGIYGTTVSNWLILNITTSQTLIPMLGTSAITADLTHDNLGNYYNPVSGHVPDGTIVSFGGILGSVKPGSENTSNGQATAIFKASFNSGITTVYAIVDNAIANTPITIFAVMTDIYVSTTGSDTTGDGSQGNPYQTILRGISAVPSGGNLHIANGVYTGAGNNNIAITKDINIIGQSSSAIINGESTSRIFTIISGTTVTIQNLTLANGTATYGGSIYNAGNLAITGSTFTGNTATYGGAIYNTGTLTVTGSTFIGNTVTLSGGAIFNQGGTLTATGCTFTNNNAAKYGGAIYNYIGTSTVNFSRIIGNTASQDSSAISYGWSPVNANYNWWGSNTGPAIGSVGGSSNPTTWLVLNITSSTSLINNNIPTSTITADLTHDNLGNYHNPVYGHVPDRMPVTFKTTLGTIGNSFTVNGIAQSTLKVGSTTGVADVSATVDNQTAHISVNVDTIPPKVTSTNPKNGATGCSRTANIYLKFSENIKTSVYWSKIVVKDKYGHTVSITKWISGNTFYIKTNSKRLSYSYYTVYIPASSVKDNAGNNLAAGYTFKFKTGAY